MNRSNWQFQKWLAAGAFMIALVLGLTGLLSPSTSGVAGAAPSIGGMHFSLPVALSGSNNGGLRRESIPPSNGQAPLTGPASAFTPLDVPNFGTNVRANTDTQTPNLAQQEPSIAVNPTNPLNVVAAAKDERSGTNTKQIWIYTSTDGGQTWINQIFPMTPQSPFSSDPVVNFSDDGICYVTALPYGGGSGDGVQVARSLDGGITFSTGVHLPGTNGNSDKEWTWVDNNPASPFYHRVYTAWMNFSPGFRVDYSTDQGQTFTLAPLSQSAYQFPMPISYPNGQVQVIFANPSSMSNVRSTDGGTTWTAAQNISGYTDANCPPDNSGCGIWRLNSIPAIAVNNTTSNAVVVWADGAGGTSTIKYSLGTSNGTVWSAAQILAPPGVANTYQVEPWVAVDPSGTFHAIWYDDRANPNTSIFNIYYSQSTDDGQTWSTAANISTATTDLRIGIPSSYALAAGDYINVAVTTGNVYAVWTDTRSGTGEDIYVVRGTSGGTPTPTVTGTPPTATNTSTPTSTPTSTNTSTPSSTRTSTSTATSTVLATSTSSPTSVSTDTATSTSTSTSTVETATSTAETTSTATAVSTDTPVATATVCTLQFTDVTAGDTFYANIRCLACMGIINGYPCGGAGEPCDANNNPYFRPGNDVTRGQIAKIVSNSAGFSDPAGEQQYADVLPGSSFYDFIWRLTNRGLVAGYPCGGVGEPCGSGNLPYFRPASTATRGQLAKIVSNAAGFDDTPTGQTFQDVVPGSTFYVFVERLATRNVMSGYPCGGPGEPCVAPGNLPYFRPSSNVSRGQTSKIVANTFFPDCAPLKR